METFQTTGRRDSTSDVLVSLTLSSCSTVHRFYVNCTCLGRALHTAGLTGGGLPSHPHTHTYLCSTYPDTTPKIYWIPFKSWTHSCATCISSPWESVQLVYKYLKKCVSIREMIGKQDKCSSISIYLSSLYFTHGHIFRSGQLRSKSTYDWHLGGFEGLPDILEEYHM